MIPNHRKLVLVSPGFRVASTLPIFINSVKVQSYSNWECILIDDNSPDDTFEVACELTESDERFTVLRNSKNKYQLRNWYDIIALEKDWIKDDDIIVFFDMDDWFGDKYVFERIIKEYLYRPWIKATTASNFQLSDYYVHEAAKYTDRQQLLDAKFHMFSLFTYTADLFRRIPKEHFIDPDTGEFYKVCGDLAITMPILWYAGPENCQHLYLDKGIVYNNIRPLCDDNKKEDSGISSHKTMTPKLIKSFNERIVPSGY